MFRLIVVFAWTKFFPDSRYLIDYWLSGSQERLASECKHGNDDIVIANYDTEKTSLQPNNMFVLMDTPRPIDYRCLFRLTIMKNCLIRTAYF